MKLKQLKEQPLLNPPGESVWPEITATDVKLMRERLAFSQDKTEMLYLMKELGHPQKMSRKDVDDMMVSLGVNYEDYPERSYTGYTAMVYMLGELGVLRITDKSRRVIQVGLENRRRNLEGKDIVEMLYYMKRLGLPYEITEKDKKIINEHLGGHRGAKNTYITQRMEFYARMVGIPVEPMELTRENILEQLEESRERKDGYEIALLHHFMRGLYPEVKTQRGETIPPLKRFGK